MMNGFETFLMLNDHTTPQELLCSFLLRTKQQKRRSRATKTQIENRYLNNCMYFLFSLIFDENNKQEDQKKLLLLRQHSLYLSVFFLHKKICICKCFSRLRPLQKAAFSETEMTQSNDSKAIELVFINRTSHFAFTSEILEKKDSLTVTIYVYGYAEVLSMVYFSTNMLLISRYQQHQQQAEQSQQEGKFHTLD